MEFKLYEKNMCESTSGKLVAPMLNFEENEIVPKDVFCLMIVWKER
jgi:hypothetical protein